MTSKSTTSLALFILVGVCLLRSTHGQSLSSLCPLDCTCSDIEINHHTYGHAKCSSLKGLREIGKDATIQSVDCSAIEISKITTQLDKLTNLTRLDLSNNHISEVPKLSKRIRVLNLAHNSITSGKLSKIPLYVRHLNLSHNDITYLPLEFKELIFLKSLELMGNPINCTCETLQVRNWLQDNRVWTDNHVTCSSPLRFKGQPWLQVKQSEVCPPKLGEPTSLTYIWDDQENELMQGDQPIIGDGSGSGSLPDEDELGKEYLPIEPTFDHRTHIQSSSEMSGLNEDYEGSGSDDYTDEKKTSRLTNYDGSGDDRIASTTENIEDDGSGSGDGIVVIPKLDTINIIDESTESDLEETTRAPYELNIFNNGVSIHKVDDESNSETSSTAAPVNEASIIPARMVPTYLEKNEPSKNEEEKANLSDAESDEVKETKSTYILLGLLGFLLVGLIVFVIFRKKGANRSNRRSKSDVENPAATEMLDMNKQLLGKPINRNGNGNVEIIPLMPKNTDHWDGEKPSNGHHVPEKVDMQKAEEPLLNRINAPDVAHEKPQSTVPPSDSHLSNGNAQLPNENIEDSNNRRPEQSAPAGSRLAPPQVQEPQLDDEVFMPISPKPSRYSPVYSPETGRVKIKLTETPKPRTPMLITRSRSNAGEIISTPVRPPKSQ